MADQGTVSVFALRALAVALSGTGASVSALLADLDLSPALLAETDTRVPAPIAFRAFEEAARRAGDPDFALHAATAIPLGALGFLDYHARSSPTLGEALRRTIRYFALVN